MASPPPSWEQTAPGRERPAAARTSSGAPQHKKANPAHPGTEEPVRSETAAPPAGEATGSGTAPWDGFVAFVKGKKPLLASILENGRPLKIAPGHLEIGFLKGSFQLNSLQDPAALTELRGLADAFFRKETVIRLAPLSEVPADAPATLLEKKNLDEANRVRMIKEVAERHPMVAAALEIFGGEIAEISESDEIKK